MIGRYGLALLLIFLTPSPMLANHISSLPEAPPGYIAQWPIPGGSPGIHMGICTDIGGNVYVTDTDFIHKFSNSGTLLMSLNVAQAPLSASANDVVVDQAGNIYFINENTDRLFKLNSSGVLITSWGTHGNGQNDWYGAHVLATNGTSRIYVLDWGNNRLFEYSLDGVFVGSVSTFEEPQGLAVAPSGCVARTGYRTHSVVGCINLAPSPGGGYRHFLWPTGIAYDPFGNFYVSETSTPPDYPFGGGENHRVQKFDSQGQFLTAITGGAGYGNLNDPWDLATDQFGNLFVLDRDNYRVLKFGYQPVPTQATTWSAIKALYE